MKPLHPFPRNDEMSAPQEPIVEDRGRRPPTVTQGDAARFFLPLILMAEMMMITHSVIHASLARQPFPTIALAGFSIAFSMTGLFSSAFRALHQIALTYITGRASIRRVWKFGATIAVFNAVTMGLIALTPLGDWIYGGMLGAGPRVVAEARMASAAFAFIYPLQMTRNVAAGLLMVNRHTLLISYGTLLRLISLGGFLAALSLTVHGARLGAASLVACIAVEAAFVVFFAWPFYRQRPESKGALPGYGEIWRFAWPLILNAMMENGLVVLVNVFVGRLPKPDLALAAFGVVRGLLMLMMSPLRNLAQTAQALTRTGADLRVVVRFARLAMVAFMALILLLFYTPLRDVLLGRVMALPADLIAYIEPALLLFVITPFFWGHAALYRGLLAGARQTNVLATTSAVRLAAVGAVSSACLFWPQVNGAVVGVLAMAGAFACESVLLGRSLNGLVAAGRAFPSLERAPSPGAAAGD